MESGGGGDQCLEWPDDRVEERGSESCGGETVKPCGSGRKLSMQSLPQHSPTARD